MTSDKVKSLPWSTLLKADNASIFWRVVVADSGAMALATRSSGLVVEGIVGLELRKKCLVSISLTLDQFMQVARVCMIVMGINVNDNP